VKTLVKTPLDSVAGTVLCGLVLTALAVLALRFLVGGG
jgi:hypothetical protein